MTWIVMINNGSLRSFTRCFISNVKCFAFVTRTCWATIWHIFCVCFNNGLPDLSCANSTLRLLLSSDERLWVVLVSTTGCTDLSEETVSSWKEFTPISLERDVFLPSCTVLVSAATTGCPDLSVLTTGCPDLSRLGFGIGWLDWELLGCCTTYPSARWAWSEPNSLFQSCFKEILGRGRRWHVYFSYMTSPVSILTTFGIQKAGSVSWRMMAFDRVW